MINRRTHIHTFTAYLEFASNRLLKSTSRRYVGMVEVMIPAGSTSNHPIRARYVRHHKKSDHHRSETADGY